MMVLLIRVVAAALLGGIGGGLLAAVGAGGAAGLGLSVAVAIAAGGAIGDRLAGRSIRWPATVVQGLTAGVTAWLVVRWLAG